MVHTTDHTQLTLPVRCASRKPTDGHRSRLSGCGGYWRTRTERAVSGLTGTSRPNASPSAPEPPDRCPHARLQQPAPAERTSLARRSAPPRRPHGGGCPCTKPAKGISKRSASAVGHEHREEEQERAPGRLPRGHRGRDCREEGRWRKGSRRGHARRERPRRGRAPGPPPGSRTPLPGRGRRQVTARGFEILSASARTSSTARHKEEVARSSLCSLRWPPAGNGRWSQPAKGFSKRSESAGTHRDKDLEQQRSPDHTPRGARGMGGSKEERAVGQGGAGLARTHERRAPFEAGRGGTQKIRGPGTKK